MSARRVRLVLPAAALSAVVVAGVTLAARQTPTFKARVSLVRLDALVTHDGRPVSGLTAADFEVTDNGVRQSLRVATTAGNVSVVLALDTSASLEGEKLEQLAGASQALVDLLRPDDDLSLLTFTDRLTMPAGLSRDRATIRAALTSAKASGTTALWDALFGALALARSPAGERSLVLLFTDGLENASWLREDDLAESVRRSESVIYVVWPPDPPVPSRDVTDAKRRLWKIVLQTGGSAVETDSYGHLTQRFTDVFEEFRSRYLLSYEPTGVRQDDGWHKVEVRVKGVRGTVKTRPGYYAR